MEQVSLDLQREFPNAEGLSAPNLWAMKRWYLFYNQHDTKLLQSVIEMNGAKLLQPVIEFDKEKLQQLVAEFPAPYTKNSRLRKLTNIESLAKIPSSKKIRFHAKIKESAWGCNRY